MPDSHHAARSFPRVDRLTAFYALVAILFWSGLADYWANALIGRGAEYVIARVLFGLLKGGRQ